MAHFVRHLGLLCAGLALCATRPAFAEAARARLLLPKGSQVQLAVLRDGFSVGLLLEHMDAHAAQAALAPLHAQQMSAQSFGQHGLLVLLQFDSRVQSARASIARVAREAPAGPAPRASDANGPAGSPNAAAVGAGAPPGGASAAMPPPVPVPPPNAGLGASGPALATATAGGNVVSATVPAKAMRKAPRLHVDIDVAFVEPLTTLLEHVMADKLPLPGSLEHHRLWDAEQAFSEHRVAEAELILNGLAPKGPFVTWVSLRQGDLSAYHGDVDAACGKYAFAQKQSDVHVPAQLAALRSHVLGCPSPGKVDWKSLLSRAGRDDPVGRMMNAEARWALQSERDPNTLDQVLTVIGGRRGDPLPADLYDSLAARNLRQRTPMQKLLAARRLPFVKGQDEAFDLALELGQAWCALDVPERFVAPALALRSWVHGKNEDKKARIHSVAHCRGLDEPAHAAAISRAPRPAVEQALAGIEARVKRASRAAQARAAGLRALQAPPDAPAAASSGTASTATPPSGGP